MSQSAHVKAGIDALSFVRQLEGGWDLVIWDPPYFSPNAEDSERLNSRSRNFNLTKKLRVMDPLRRDEILNLIKAKMDPLGRIIYFQTDLTRIPKNYECLHGWVKSTVLSGSPCPSNIEWMAIFGSSIKKAPGRILNQYLPYPYELKYNGGFPRLVRGCAKPEALYEDLYRHTDAKHVLDPFAGFGRSISAAIKNGIRIDACDIDHTLQAQYDSYLTNHIDNFFTEVS